jgi:hypothetical protein
MTDRRRHPKNPVEAALQRLEALGFTVIEVHNGHIWGRVICTECVPRPDNDNPKSIWGTPKNPDNFGKQLDQFGRRHRHSTSEGSAT